jgi:hypothetical protein
MVCAPSNAGEYADAGSARRRVRKPRTRKPRSASVAESGECMYSVTLCFHSNLVHVCALLDCFFAVQACVLRLLLLFVLSENGSASAPRRRRRSATEDDANGTAFALRTCRQLFMIMCYAVLLLDLIVVVPSGVYSRTVLQWKTGLRPPLPLSGWATSQVSRY